MWSYQFKVNLAFYSEDIEWKNESANSLGTKMFSKRKIIDLKWFYNKRKERVNWSVDGKHLHILQHLPTPALGVLSNARPMRLVANKALRKVIVSIYCQLNLRPLGIETWMERHKAVGGWWPIGYHRSRRADVVALRQGSTRQLI